MAANSKPEPNIPSSKDTPRSEPSRTPSKQRTTPPRSAHLLSIDTFVSSLDLTSTCDQLPDPSSYTFALSTNKSLVADRTLLFLGETESFQAWGRLTTSPLKPDSVEFVLFSFLSGSAMAVSDLRGLPLNMYPFCVVGEERRRERLEGLVRYVFREAGGFDGPFEEGAREVLGSVLGDVREAIERAGGVEKLLDIHPPSKLPKSLSLIELAGVQPEGRDTLVIDSSSSSEDEIDFPSSAPPARAVFEVPSLSKSKKPTKSKARLKSKSKATAPTAKKVTAKSKHRTSVTELADKPHNAPSSIHGSTTTAANPYTATIATANTRFTTLARNVTPAKRRASTSPRRSSSNPTPNLHGATDADAEGDTDATAYTALSALENERAAISREKSEISQRKVVRQREEMVDEQREKELNERIEEIEGKEELLLEGRSAGWLLGFQRAQGKRE